MQIAPLGRTHLEVPRDGAGVPRQAADEVLRAAVALVQRHQVQAQRGLNEIE